LDDDEEEFGRRDDTGDEKGAVDEVEVWAHMAVALATAAAAGAAKAALNRFATGVRLDAAGAIETIGAAPDDDGGGDHVEAAVAVVIDSRWKASSQAVGAVGEYATPFSSRCCARRARCSVLHTVGD
jgi:hypothetical protein